MLQVRTPREWVLGPQCTAMLTSTEEASYLVHTVAILHHLLLSGAPTHMSGLACNLTSPSMVQNVFEIIEGWICHMRQNNKLSENKRTM